MKFIVSSFRSWAVIVLLNLVGHVAFAASITGAVTDKTFNKPSVGDDVVLISLAQKMQETARTKTDSAGRYRLDVPDAGMHLVRVDHQKAAYFAAVAPGATKVDVNVYDVASKVEGLTMEADMLRIETDDQGFHVIESYFLKNDSSPARTQFSAKSFEMYLPSDAKISASIAMGPGGMPVASSPVPLGDPGHYAFVFPIRPGETRFQVEYHLPLAETRTFQAQVSLPVASYVVVLPQTMTLNAKSGTTFGPMSGDPNTRSLVAKNIAPGTRIAFSVAGSGTLPQEAGSVQAGAENDTAAAPSTSADTRPGGGMAPPIDTPDPLDKYKWWILSGIALALAIGAGLFLRPRSTSIAQDRIPAPVIGGPFAQKTSPREIWMVGLKEELFSLETEHLTGVLSEEEYQEQKRALEVVLKRAISHGAKRTDAVLPEDALRDKIQNGEDTPARLPAGTEASESID